MTLFVIHGVELIFTFIHMSSFLVIIFILFLIKLLRDSLFYVWLWQIKEYRIDRMMSHLRENNTAGSIVPLGLWSRSARQEISQSVNAKRLHRAIATMEPATIFQNNLFYILTVILFLSYFIFLKNYSLIFQYLVLALFAFAFFGIIKEIKNKNLKRPKLTLKIMLIFFLLAVVYFLIALCWFYSSLKMTGELLLRLKTSALLLFIIIVNPLIISSIILAIEPIFYFQKNRIIKRAAEKMRGLKKIKVIGITGSYGKTSTKEFLYAILSQKYKIVKTEGNNNTNIGVAYTVLNKVSDEYDYFICEMGAYKIGEIKEMCGIIKPEIGILTGINEQHIDLFGSQENIIKAKFELIEALPENGMAVINEKLKAKSEKRKFKVKNLKYFSLDRIKNIKVWRDYAEFDFQTTPSLSLLKDVNAECHCEEHQRSRINVRDKLRNPEIMREELNNGIATLPSVARNDSSIIKFKLNLLGRHCIENILSAIMVAEYLGMNLEEIKNVVKKIKPTEYMMRKIKGLNDSIFIDDSYSANPDGVLAALDYLEEAYKDYKKIIVFPGIIELGKESEKVHRELFDRISGVCDIAYIIKVQSSKHALESYRGFKVQSFGLGNKDKYKFIFEANFDKTANMLKNNLDKNTVILFESRGAGVVMGKLKVQVESSK